MASTQSGGQASTTGRGMYPVLEGAPRHIGQTSVPSVQQKSAVGVAVNASTLLETIRVAIPGEPFSKTNSGGMEWT